MSRMPKGKLTRPEIMIRGGPFERAIVWDKNTLEPIHFAMGNEKIIYLDIGINLKGKIATSHTHPEEHPPSPGDVIGIVEFNESFGRVITPTKLFEIDAPRRGFKSSDLSKVIKAMGMTAEKYTGIKSVYERDGHAFVLCEGDMKTAEEFCNKMLPPPNKDIYHKKVLPDVLEQFGATVSEWRLKENN
jgi:hypothetical protein